MSKSEPAPPIDATLFLAPGCPHCPTVLSGLSELVKKGQIGQLTVVNIASHPELAEERGVRSVPWFQLGELEFQGLHSAKELKYWAEQAATEAGFETYVSERLESGELAIFEDAVRQHPDWLHRLVPIMANMEASINVRVGIGALFESLADDGLLLRIVPDLIELTEHPDPRVRGDACHTLGLSGAPEAREALLKCREDDNPDVRDIANDALQQLKATN